MTVCLVEQSQGLGCVLMLTGLTQICASLLWSGAPTFQLVQLGYVLI